MKKNWLTIIFTVLCLLSGLAYAREFPIASPQAVGVSPEKLAGVRTAVQDLIDNKKIAGASVVVARKGSVVFSETFGMVDMKAQKAVQADTIFRFYSMTKPITSVAVMMLYEEGKLKLDDPVSQYIPEFEGLKVYADSGEHEKPIRPMSVRDLLRHTSGLTYGYFGNTPVDKMYRSKNIFDQQSPLEEMARKLSEIPLLFQPGTKWHYSVSTDVLGYVVEKVSGQSLDVFFEERIFRPLGMKDTAFYVPRSKVNRFAVCYGPKLGGGLKVVDEPLKSRYLSKPAMFYFLFQVAV